MTRRAWSARRHRRQAGPTLRLPRSLRHRARRALLESLLQRVSPRMRATHVSSTWQTRARPSAAPHPMAVPRPTRGLLRLSQSRRSRRLQSPRLLSQHLLSQHLRRRSSSPRLRRRHQSRRHQSRPARSPRQRSPRQRNQRQRSPPQRNQLRRSPPQRRSPLQLRLSCRWSIRLPHEHCRIWCWTPTT
jgi:hypothetical protein